MQRWKNIAIVPEEKTLSKTSTVATKGEKAAGWFIAGLAIVLLLIIVSVNSPHEFWALPWLLLKTIGVSVTILLLIYETDKQNDTVKQFCKAGKTVNCEAVLQSKGATFKGYSWSEIGFAYFAGTLICMLLLVTQSSVFMVVSVASLLVLPYTIYSVYYQYKVVKQWCRLCLMVQVVLLVEGLLAIGWMYKYATVTASLNWQGAVLLFLLMVLLLIGWRALKTSFKKASVADNYKYAYLRLHNTPDVFYAMLQSQMQAPDGFGEVGLWIGNKSAKDFIIKVCNPFCGPCAAAHPILERIVERSDVRLCMLFTGTNNPSDKSGEVARHFITLYNEVSIKIANEAMHWWYSQALKKIDELKERYPLPAEHNEEMAAAQLAKMAEWETKAEIAFTPTVYVNGYRLPETYTVQQLAKMYSYQ